MRCARVAFVAALLLAFGFGSLLTLSGCGGKNVGEGGVNVGGAQADPQVEAREKQAAAEEAAAAKK